ncbi:peroxynitrite isomerase THAP4 [Neodiprion pinetum]|uniref:peroxynitrite isomerase THAP4 n=1 Tax=Neodiprion pinetum TaxID=441929 RepID=UPI00076FD382|nr:peroxynitrite isomerase THAP4-like [Neodiprion pinetum]XP_046491317.1 peroxynitrite isomerase THAP4-like [Neodiprion pinetum]XP_046628506.1 peroxynitrite isomerase THAP4-like [Neodiprion virginianus]
MDCNQPMHPALKTLAWLEGTWRAENTGEGKFPTIKAFKFCEEISFSSIGQPMLNYVGQSWHSEKKKPMHREVGFLKIIPGSNKVSLILAHNFGLTTIEEGHVNDFEITLKSTNVSRMSEGCKEPVVLKTEREFRLVGSMLEQTIRMATTNVGEISEHIRTVYQKTEK